MAARGGEKHRSKLANLLTLIFESRTFSVSGRNERCFVVQKISPLI